MTKSIRYVLAICAIGLSATLAEPSFAQTASEDILETANATESIEPVMTDEQESVVTEDSEILAEANQDLANTEEADVESEAQRRNPLPCRIFPSASMMQ